MDFLALCNQVASDSGTQDGETTLSTVVNQTGRLAKIVRWTNDAYLAIQNARQNWRWLQSEFYLSTVTAQQRYLGTECVDSISNGLITRFSAFTCKQDGTEDRFSIYDPAIGLTDKGRLHFIPWGKFYRDRVNSSVANDRPVAFSIDQAGRLCLSPTPDKVYRILGPYRKSAQDLTSGGTPNTNVPEMPADFHNVISSVALQFLGTHDEAPLSQLQLWQLRQNRDFCRLDQEQLPQWRFGEPLA